MNTRWLNLFFSLTLGLVTLVGVLALLGTLSNGPSVIHAQGGAGLSDSRR